MRTFLETHFSIVLLLACVVGLVMPGMPQLPNVSSIVALALLTFNSCYRLRDGAFAEIRWRRIALFYALRYGALPVALWWVAQLFVPEYALGIFLLAMLPAGVASPAFAHIYGGVVAPAFAIVILSQVMAPLLIPLQFAWMGGAQVAPAPAQLFATLVWCVFVPMLVYAGVRNHTASRAFMVRNNKLFSILLVAFVIALAVAKQREVIVGNLPELAVCLALTLSCFALYIAFGWAFARGKERAERITYATCSAFNNAAMGVSLALMHFGPEVVLFVAVSEIAWAMLPLMMKLFLRFAR